MANLDKIAIQTHQGQKDKIIEYQCAGYASAVQYIKHDSFFFLSISSSPNQVLCPLYGL